MLCFVFLSSIVEYVSVDKVDSVSWPRFVVECIRLLSFIELRLVSFLNLIHDDIARFLPTDEKIALLVCVCWGDWHCV